MTARCDSFVLESNIHYPTDINLLNDALRCSIRTVAQLCECCGKTDWRQWQYNTRHVKKAFRIAQTLKHSTSKDPQKREKRQQAMREAHEDYIVLCAQYLVRIEQTLEQLPTSVLSAHTLEQLRHWMAYGWKQIDLIRRRVIEGEKIPHHEKIFSIFEDYSEWLSKGKAGVAVELGLNVCIMESSSGFILHHKVMQHCTDSEVAIDMVKQSQQKFPDLSVCSFDKGFHSPENQRVLADLLERVVLPKKGKRNQVEQARETSEAFIQTRRQHSAVESGINALEVHGLDRCPDRGLEHFKRYVALAVVGRNLQKLGAVLQAQARKDLHKRTRRKSSSLVAAA